MCSRSKALTARYGRRSCGRKGVFVPRILTCVVEEGGCNWREREREEKGEEGKGKEDKTTLTLMMMRMRMLLDDGGVQPGKGSTALGSLITEGVVDYLHRGKERSEARRGEVHTERDTQPSLSEAAAGRHSI